MAVVTERSRRRRASVMIGTAMAILVALALGFGFPFAVAHATGVFTVSGFHARFVVLKREPASYYHQGYRASWSYPGQQKESWSRFVGPFLVRLERSYVPGKQ